MSSWFRKALSIPAITPAVLLLFTACPKPAPIVRQQTFAVSHGALARVAVMPFYPTNELTRSAKQGGESAWAAAALITRFVTEAMTARGMHLIPASDLETAFIGQGQVAPRLDPQAAARVAARDFGVTGVLLGQVSRYRDRSGDAIGSTVPASVAFEVTLYAAPSGRRLQTARFHETQKTLTESLFEARRYPGGGTRWLSAAELARWGAEATADALGGR